MTGDDKSQTVNKISTDMTKPFNGEGDVASWLKKVELVGKLTGVKDLALLIPLYLEGGALAVFMEMSDADQGSADEIKRTLKRAFSDSVFGAYAKLIGFKWTGEAVDVYANELRRLAGLAGFDGDALEHIVKLSFINGFPDNIGMELQQIKDIELKQVTMTSVIGRARILATNRGVSVGAVAVSKEPVIKSKGFAGKCFRCGGPHMIKDCPDRSERKQIICYSCREEGHIAPKCPNKPSTSKSENC